MLQAKAAVEISSSHSCVGTLGCAVANGKNENPKMFGWPGWQTTGSRDQLQAGSEVITWAPVPRRGALG